jgi:hypothetical protein
VAERVERIAANLPWAAPFDALYDREPDRWPPRAAEVTRALAALRSDWRAEDLRPLLADANPKVRTLAIVLLFRLERLDVLPDIARLVGDEAQTFPEAVLVDGGQPDPWPMDPHTVGDYARFVIDAYADASYELDELRKADRLAYDKPEELARQMAHFASRRDVSLSTAGLRVAMNIATGQITPLQPDRMERVDDLLGRAGDVPEPRRFFALLAIDNERLHGPESPDDYLLSEARRLPREVRMRTVRCDSGDDPDLEPGFGRHYLLDHGVDLFRASDVDTLLHIEERLHRHDPPWTHDAGYVLTAAQLRPADADRLLTDALRGFDSEAESEQRTRLATALALTGTDRGENAAIDWFFSPSPLTGVMGIGREKFLQTLHDRDAARYRRIVARIIRDNRLPSLGPASTVILVTSVEGYTGHQIASEDEVRTFRSYSEGQREQAGKLLGDWQRMLRETVDEWGA